jgi:tetratricopeptide (TPR) repeat protein
VLLLSGPDAPTLHRLVGLYQAQADEEKEEKALRALSVLEPTNADPLIRLATLRAAAKDPAGVEAALTEATAREPLRIEAQLQLAKLELDQGVFYRALERYRAVKAADPGNQEALAGIEKLERSFKLRNRSLKGNINGIFWAISDSLDKLYTEHKAAFPALAGKLKLKVRVNARGTSDGVEVLDDTLKDPVLLGHAFFSLRDADYWEKKQFEPIVDFELGGKNGRVEVKDPKKDSSPAHPEPGRGASATSR